MLLMCLFLKHLPQLVEAGKIYSAVAPLYKVTNRQGVKFYYSDAEVRDKQGDVVHYKGLGEMTQDELYETILNPESRRLVQLKPTDFQAALDTYETLMGKSSLARKNFIVSHKISDVDDVFDDEEGAD